MPLFSSAALEIELLSKVEQHLEMGTLEDWLCERIGRAHAELRNDINYLEQLAL